jgi:hypothetical protein
MAKKHMEKFSPFLTIREMQIKTMLRFHLILFRMVTIKNTITTNVGEDLGKKEPSYTDAVNVN